MPIIYLSFHFNTYIIKFKSYFLYYNKISQETGVFCSNNEEFKINTNSQWRQQHEQYQQQPQQRCFVQTQQQPQQQQQQKLPSTVYAKDQYDADALLREYSPKDFGDIGKIKFKFKFKLFIKHFACFLGFSSIANAPEFIRPFQSEYTVNEGEKIKIDCLMVGNPRPRVNWFFNDRPIKSNNQFAEVRFFDFLTNYCFFF